MTSAATSDSLYPSSDSDCDQEHGGGSHSSDSDSEIIDGEIEVASSSSEPKKARRDLKSTGTGRFKRSWNLPKFITESTKGKTFAYCQLCLKDFMVSHSGFSDIRRHCESMLHKRRYNESQRNSSIATILRRSQASKVVSAEVMMAQFIAMHNLPFQAADHLSGIMFPDSKIAAEFSCRHTKTKAIICDVIDPFLKDPLISLLRTSPYNLLCDESNERGDAVKLLTVLVRIYEPATCTVVTRHLDTIGIVDFTAEGIFTALKGCFESRKTPFTKLLSFTSDTCNVMKGVRGGVIAKLKVLQPM